MRPDTTSIERFFDCKLVQTVSALLEPGERVRILFEVRKFLCV
jgi:hypothetical protein